MGVVLDISCCQYSRYWILTASSWHFALLKGLTLMVSEGGTICLSVLTCCFSISWPISVKALEARWLSADWVKQQQQQQHYYYYPKKITKSVWAEWYWNTWLIVSLFSLEHFTGSDLQVKLTRQKFATLAINNKRDQNWEIVCTFVNKQDGHSTVTVCSLTLQMLFLTTANTYQNGR